MTRDWKDKLDKVNGEESGFILMMALFVIVVLFLLGTTLAILGIQEFTLSARTKMMDQAYTLADAGVNRAAAQVQSDVSISGSTSPAYPTAQATHTETFGAGSFKYSIYQSDIMTADSSYKIIRSTGTIVKGDKTAERTIETRLVIGTGGDEYDASFDYCIYNGFRDANPNLMLTDGVSPQDTWPSNPNSNSLINYWAGSFILDGQTSNNGRPPKGAVYSRGNINLPTHLVSTLTLMGNVVATKNIALHNSWTVGPGITITGNCIAGMGTSGGNASMVSEASGSVGPCCVSGWLCAAGNVTMSGTAVINFSGQSIVVGGIIAGGNATFTTTATAGGGLQLNQVYAHGMVNISNTVGGGSIFTLINAGRDGSGNGVDLYTVASLGTINGGVIYSQGRVHARTNWSVPISIGEIHAGTSSSTDLGGTGVALEAQMSTVSTGAIWSRGKVTISNGGFWVSVNDVVAGTDSITGWGGIGIDANLSGVWFGAGSLKARGGINATSGSVGGTWNSMWSGGSINFNTSSCGLSVGPMSAMGSIDADATIIFTGGYGFGRMKANGSVDLKIDMPGGLGSWNGVNGLEAGGNVRFEGAEGVSVTISTFTVGTLSGESSGSWPGCNPGQDSIWSGGNIFLKVSGGSVLPPFPAIMTLNGDHAEAFGGVSDDGGWGWYNYSGHGGTVPSGWTPGVTDPGTPPMPAMASYPGPTSSLNNLSLKLQPTPPTVDRTLLLNMAGLSEEVNLLEPNWDYFKTQATMDDLENPGTSTHKSYHMITDGSPGDDGPGGDNQVLFNWDSTKAYSSNETIYIADGMPLTINVDWSGPLNASFQGTIVSKGNVTIGKSGLAWTINRSQTINVVGNNITCASTGAALAYSNTCNFHFWAAHNIDLSNKTLCFAGTNIFNGSFTAGNEVFYQSNAVWDTFRMNWSRWALDPVAWKPPFKVQTWKEI